MQNESRDGAPRRKVWDLPVRIMHWGLVLAVAGAWASQEFDGIPFFVHLWCGYAVLLIAATRVIWGFVGTHNARFSSFVRGPGSVIAYARGLFGAGTPRVAGHNPLGALMILAFLAMLLAQAASGLFANDEIFDTGPLFGYVSEGTSDQLTTWHKQLFDLILIAVVVHVVAVLFHLVFKHENLIGPMFSGRKPAEDVPEAFAIGSSRFGLFLIVLGSFAGLLWWVVRSAPPADLFGF